MEITTVSSPDYVEKVEPLLAELDEFHVKAGGGRFVPRSQDERIASLKTLINGGGFLTICQESGTINGFLAMSKLGERKYRIEYILVREEKRRSGMGKRLIEKGLQGIGTSEVFVSVYWFNQEAVKFYDRIFQRSSVVYRTTTA